MTDHSLAPRRGTRIPAIDVLRGVIMVLMALDHTRDFVFGFVPDPTDLETTTPALFATRWITHLCAPGFLLLAGVSACLQRPQRGAAGLAVFLVTRGLFLVVLELTVVTFGWIPDPTRTLVLLQVIWAIGWSMVLMAPLVFLPARWVAFIGIGLAALHPALSGALVALGVPDAALILLLDANDTLAWDAGTSVIVSYPILPWTGVMAAGYGLGAMIAQRPDTWAGPVIGYGCALVAGFVVLRGSGAGFALGVEPVPWDHTAAGTLSAMSFLNCEKYPPSPLYLMMTLGPILIVLGSLQRAGDPRFASVIQAFGRAPLFFYVLHLYALRIFGLAAAAAVWGVDNLGPPPQPSSPEWPLSAVWAIWLCAMVVLFYPTRWFAERKARSRRWWMSYL